MEMYASDRFLKAYRKASPGLQNLAEGAIHDLVGRYRSDPRTVSHAYDRVATISDAVLEIDLSGSHRLLAVYKENQLVMVDMGGHDTVRRYTPDKLVQDLLDKQEAPAQFWPEKSSEFFISLQDRTVPFHYPTEISPDWLYFLEEEQESTLTEIFVPIAETRQSQKKVPYPYLILGGPGTGKTCILLGLLKNLVDEGLQVGITISENLVEYIEMSTNARLREYLVTLDDITGIEVMLVDDPKDVRQLENALLLAKLGDLKAVVVAFDPLQLSASVSDGEFWSICQRYGIEGYYRLSNCYRQKQNVGGAAKHVADVIAESTPFLREDKIENYREERQQLTDLANDLVFLNPHGYIHYYEKPHARDFQSEVERILQTDWLLWKHWPGLLIVEGARLPKTWDDALALLYRRNYVYKVAINNIAEIKGLEYQHVFVLLEHGMFNEIQGGFKGSGRKIYDKRRLLRIPFTRAKDSLVTFVVS